MQNEERAAPLPRLRGGEAEAGPPEGDVPRSASVVAVPRGGRGEMQKAPACAEPSAGREGRMKKGELDHGLHGLTRIKGRSHPSPSVSFVVTFCGMRIGELQSPSPLLRAANVSPRRDHPELFARLAPLNRRSWAGCCPPRRPSAECRSRDAVRT